MPASTAPTVYDVVDKEGQHAFYKATSKSQLAQHLAGLHYPKIEVASKNGLVDLLPAFGPAIDLTKKAAPAVDAGSDDA